MTAGRRRVLAANPLDALLQPPSWQEDGTPPAEGHQDDGSETSEHRHDDGAPMAEGRERAVGAPSVRRRTARHKLTTYLPGPLYDWVVCEVDDAKRDGHPAAIADVVRFALEAVRAGNLDELRRRLRGQ